MIFFYKVTRCFYVAIIQSFDDRMCMNTQWRGRGRDRAAAQGGTLQEATFEGRKFGILAFALQCVSVSLYLFLIYSVHRGWVLPVGGAAPRTFAPGGKTLAPPL